MYSTLSKICFRELIQLTVNLELWLLIIFFNLMRRTSVYVNPVQIVSVDDITGLILNLFN